MQRSYPHALLLALACLLSTSALPAQELTEGNAASWGTFASDGATSSVTNSTSRVRVGLRSLRFDTLSGFDTGVRYPKGATAHWNLTAKTHLVFTAWADNPNVDFQDNQPVVVLKTPTGNLTYTPQGTFTNNHMWTTFSVPLAGNAKWVRTVTGSPNLGDVNQLEIHQDTWDYGFTVYYDGMQFVTAPPGGPPSGPPPPPGVNPDAISPRVGLYIIDPIMSTRGNQRMHTVYGWGDSVALTNQVVSDFAASSHGLVNFEVVDTVVIDTYPYQRDGFQYDDASFDLAWTTHSFHDSEFDYNRFIADNNIAARVMNGDLDEVWIYAFPGCGLWESTMAGSGGYWCNAWPVPNVPSEKLFVVMGWNYERGVGEAIHSFGHRAESIMAQMYGSWEPNQNNNWSKFALLDINASGLGGVGNCHYPVNGESDYDYFNPRFVLSNCDDWANYPSFTGVTRSINCLEWSPNGVDPQREYLNWWYSHMPHFPGRGTDNYLNNWWRYLVDVDPYKGRNIDLYGTLGQPTVNLLAPGDGGTVSGMVRVVADAFVNGALGRVDLYVDGAYFGTDTIAPYVFPWDATALSGPHTLTAKAYELQNGTEGVSQTITVNVSATPVQLKSLTLSPTSVKGGTAATGTVTLNQPAKAGGSEVTLTSANPAVASTPASVLVPEGLTSASFAIGTAVVTADTNVKIEAQLGTDKQSATLIVAAHALTGLTLTPVSDYGGKPFAGTVTIDAPAPAGGLAVSLTTSHTSVTVPATVAIAEGATTAGFIATSVPVAADTAVTATATYGGSTATADVTVKAPLLLSVKLNPTTVRGGLGATGTVTLTQPPPAGLIVALSSSNTAAATVPATVSFEEGSLTAAFAISTSVVASQKTSAIAAALNGASKSATLTVRPISVASVKMTPSSIVGGKTTSGTVTLEAVAAPNSITVVLTSNAVQAQVVDGAGNPLSSVVVPAGSATAGFFVKTSPVSANKTVKIRGAANGLYKEGSLTLKPIPPASVTVTPNPVVGGVRATGTVTLELPAAPGSVTVALSSSNSAVAQIVDSANNPITSVSVAAGALSKNFFVKTAVVTAATSVTIKATAGGVTKSMTLKVVPNAVASITLNPTSVKGGAGSTATVTLAGPAAAGGMTVTLSSSNSAVAWLVNGSGGTIGSVVIPAGQLSVNVGVKTAAVTLTKTVTLRAAAGGVTKSAVLTVTP